MSSKILLKFLGGCLALLIVMGISTFNTTAQVVSTGVTEEPAGQIVAPFLEEDEDSPGLQRHTHIQLTNTSSDPVTVHVQILNDSASCSELDFFDTFTGQDTHLYSLDEFLTTNGGAFPGFTPDPNDVPGDGYNGIVVITPVIGGADPTPIAFNHLHAVVNIFNFGEWPDGEEVDSIDTTYRFNAMGRNAVDLATGNKSADGTELDGVAAGFERIVPAEILFHYNSDFGFGLPVFSDLIFVAISDDYFGGVGNYKATSGTSAEFSVENVVDAEEFSLSCGDVDFSCLEIHGINSEIVDTNSVHSGVSSDGLICDITSYPEGFDRLFARQDEAADVTFGVIGLTTSNVGGAAHMFVK